MPEFVGALDQGTTSTRFMIFDHEGVEVARSQLEQRQIFPKPGWVEQDANEIWQRSTSVIADALAKVGLTTMDLAGIGIANQRETSIIWDRRSGEPLGPAIGWQDARTESEVVALRRSESAELIRHRTGLPISTYPSASKLAWLLDNVEGARADAERGDVLFGTVDSWLTWKMSGEHVTDVTNASRTMLMDVATLDWDDEMLDRFQIPRAMLPRVHGSTFGPDELEATRLWKTPGQLAITGMLGDQQAALVGHRCFAPQDAKNTYGTGSFLLVNTGTRPVYSSTGLITTVAYQLLDQPATYALEGAVAMVGAAVQWLRDQLGVVSSVDEIEALAESIADTAGVYFVPAFAGLFAPYWRGDARGTILGLARSHTRAHLTRAVLEAVGFQSLDVVAAIEQDLGDSIGELRVDGGVTANSLCMQLQADILGVPVVRDGVMEATALGAAYAAGLGAGFWATTDDLPVPPDSSGRRFEPTWSEDERLHRIDRWRRAVQLSLEWADDDSSS
jgi:glycerol kinase